MSVLWTPSLRLDLRREGKMGSRASAVAHKSVSSSQSTVREIVEVSATNEAPSIGV